MNNKYYQEIISEQKVEDIWADNYEGVEFNLDDCKRNINQMILSSDKYTPDSIALTYFGKTMTRAQLQEKIRVAAIAYKNMGIKNGDIVYIFELNTPETVISIYALNSIGAVTEFFNMVGVTPAKLKQAINKYQVKWMLAVDIFYDAFKSIIDETTIEKVIVNSLRDSFNKLTDFMYMTQLRILDKAVALKDKECISKSKTLLKKLEEVEKYAIDSKADRKFSFHKNRLENEKIINHSFTVPAFAKTLIDNPKIEGKDLSFLRSIIHGGECISEADDKKLDDILEEHGAGRISLHGFGQNELCGAISTSAKIEGKEKKYGTCGFPLIGCKAAILDPVTKKVLGYGKRWRRIL